MSRDRATISFDPWDDAGIMFKRDEDGVVTVEVWDVDGKSHSACVLKASDEDSLESFFRG